MKKLFSQNKIRTKVIKLILKASISAVFVFWIIFKVKWNDVLFYIREINIWFTFIFILVFLIGIFISGYKWKLLLREKKMQATVLDCSKLYLTGSFINNFMPSVIGGDTYRAYQMGKKFNNKYIEAASSVIADRITGFIGVMILVLFFSALNILEVIKNPLLLGLNLFVLVSFGTDAVLIMLKKFPIWEIIKKIIPESILKVVAEMKQYKSNRKMFKQSIMMGIIFNLVGVGLANYILFWAFGIQIGILDYGTVIFLISMIASIPVSINNIGIKEWAYVALFGIFGIDPSAAVTVAIVSRFLQMLVSFIAIPVYLKSKTEDIILPKITSEIK
jgi:hypothetical protein